MKFFQNNFYECWLWHVCLCFWQWPLWAKADGHCSHLYGRSPTILKQFYFALKSKQNIPVWIRLWTFRRDFKVKADEHSSHLYGFSPKKLLQKMVRANGNIFQFKCYKKLKEVNNGVSVLQCIVIKQRWLLSNSY